MRYLFFFLRLFLCRPFFKVFIGLVTTELLFCVVLCFVLEVKVLTTEWPGKPLQGTI